MYCVEKLLNKLQGITCKNWVRMWNRTLHFLDEATTQQVPVQTMNCPAFTTYEAPNTVAICIREESPRFSSIDPWRHGVTRMIALCVCVCVCVQRWTCLAQTFWLSVYSTSRCNKYTIRSLIKWLDMYCTAKALFFVQLTTIFHVTT